MMRRHKTKPTVGYTPLRTQEEVAAMLSISRQAVQHIERRALAKMRKALEEDGRDVDVPKKGTK